MDLPAVAVLLVVALVAWSLGSRIAWSAAGLLWLGYAIHKLLGPMCSCHLITAVSTDKLPSLNRVRNAEKALRVIQPLIEEAQKEPAA